MTAGEGSSGGGGIIAAVQVKVICSLRFILPIAVFFGINSSAALTAGSVVVAEGGVAEEDEGVE
jgi:hypothetical protein